MLKEEYMGIMQKDMEGTAVEADYTRMDELEALYNADKEKFEAMEEDRVQKIRANLEKEFNKERMAAERMRNEVADVQKAVASQTAANTQAAADFETLTADVVKLRNQLEKLSGKDFDNANNMIRTKESKITKSQISSMDGATQLATFVTKLADAAAALAT